MKDRIRAMNDTLDDVDESEQWGSDIGDDTTSIGVASLPPRPSLISRQSSRQSLDGRNQQQQTPSKWSNHSGASPQQSQSVASASPRRASVVDIWRRRDSAGSAAEPSEHEQQQQQQQLSSPFASQGRPSSSSSASSTLKDTLRRRFASDKSNAEEAATLRAPKEPESENVSMSPFRKTAASTSNPPPRSPQPSWKRKPQTANDEETQPIETPPVQPSWNKKEETPSQRSSSVPAWKKASSERDLTILPAADATPKGVSTNNRVVPSWKKTASESDLTIVQADSTPRGFANASSSATPSWKKKSVVATPPGADRPETPASNVPSWKKKPIVASPPIDPSIDSRVPHSSNTPPWKQKSVIAKPVSEDPPDLAIVPSSRTPSWRSRLGNNNPLDGTNETGEQQAQGNFVPPWKKQVAVSDSQEAAPVQIDENTPSWKKKPVTTHAAPSIQDQVSASSTPGNKFVPAWKRKQIEANTPSPQTSEDVNTYQEPSWKKKLSSPNEIGASTDLQVVPTPNSARRGNSTMTTPSATNAEESRGMNTTGTDRPKSVADFWAQKGLKPISTTVANPTEAATPEPPPVPIQRETTPQMDTPSSRVSVLDRWKKRAQSSTGDEEIPADDDARESKSQVSSAASRTSRLEQLMAMTSGQSLVARDAPSSNGKAVVAFPSNDQAPPSFSLSRSDEEKNEKDAGFLERGTKSQVESPARGRKSWGVVYKATPVAGREQPTTTTTSSSSTHTGAPRLQATSTPFEAELQQVSHSDERSVKTTPQRSASPSIRARMAQFSQGSPPVTSSGESAEAPVNENATELTQARLASPSVVDRMAHLQRKSSPTPSLNNGAVRRPARAASPSIAARMAHLQNSSPNTGTDVGRQSLSIGVHENSSQDGAKDEELDEMMLPPRKTKHPGSVLDRWPSAMGERTMARAESPSPSLAKESDTSEQKSDIPLWQAGTPRGSIKNRWQASKQQEHTNSLRADSPTNSIKDSVISEPIPHTHVKNRWVSSRKSDPGSGMSAHQPVTRGTRAESPSPSVTSSTSNTVPLPTWQTTPLGSVKNRWPISQVQGEEHAGITRDHAQPSVTKGTRAESPSPSIASSASITAPLPSWQTTPRGSVKNRWPHAPVQDEMPNGESSQPSVTTGTRAESPSLSGASSSSNVAPQPTWQTTPHGSAKNRWPLNQVQDEHHVGMENADIAQHSQSASNRWQVATSMQEPEHQQKSDQQEKLDTIAKQHNIAESESSSKQDDRKTFSNTPETVTASEKSGADEAPSVNDDNSSVTSSSNGNLRGRWEAMTKKNDRPIQPTTRTFKSVVNNWQPPVRKQTPVASENVEAQDGAGKSPALRPATPDRVHAKEKMVESPQSNGSCPLRTPPRTSSPQPSHPSNQSDSLPESQLSLPSIMESHPTRPYRPTLVNPKTSTPMEMLSAHNSPNVPRNPQASPGGTLFTAYSPARQKQMQQQAEDISNPRVNREIEVVDEKKESEDDTEAIPTGSFVLVLMSSQSLSRDQTASYQRASSILQGHRIHFEELDGALPKNRDRRNELFELSGVRAKYPQFFIVNQGHTSYWGDWDALHFCNENGNIQSAFGFSAMPKSMAQPQKSQGALNQAVATKGVVPAKSIPIQTAVRKPVVVVESLNKGDENANGVTSLKLSQAKEPGPATSNGSESGFKGKLPMLPYNSVISFPSSLRKKDKPPPSSISKLKALNHQQSIGAISRQEADKLKSQEEEALKAAKLKSIGRRHLSPLPSVNRDNKFDIERKAAKETEVENSDTTSLGNSLGVSLTAGAAATRIRDAKRSSRIDTAPNPSSTLSLKESGTTQQQTTKGSAFAFNLHAHRAFASRNATLNNISHSHKDSIPSDDPATVDPAPSGNLVTVESDAKKTKHDHSSAGTSSTARSLIAGKRLLMRKRELQAARHQQQNRQEQSAITKDSIKKTTPEPVVSVPSGKDEASHISNIEADDEPSVNISSRISSSYEKSSFEKPSFEKPSSFDKEPNVSEEEMHDSYYEEVHENPTMGSDFFNSKLHSDTSDLCSANDNKSEVVYHPKSIPGGQKSHQPVAPMRSQKVTMPEDFISPVSNDSEVYGDPAAGTGRFSFSRNDAHSYEVASTSSGLSRGSSIANRAEKLLKQRRKKSSQQLQNASPAEKERASKFTRKFFHGESTVQESSFQPSPSKTRSAQGTPSFARQSYMQHGAMTRNEQATAETPLSSNLMQRASAAIVDRARLSSRYQTKSRFMTNPDYTQQDDFLREDSTSMSMSAMLHDTLEERPDAPDSSSYEYMQAQKPQVASSSSLDDTATYDASRLLEISTGAWTRDDNDDSLISGSAFQESVQSEYGSEFSPRHNTIAEEEENEGLSSAAESKQESNWFGMGMFKSGKPNTQKSLREQDNLIQGPSEEQDGFIGGGCNDFMQFGEESVAIEVEYMEDESEEEDEPVGFCAPQGNFCDTAGSPENAQQPTMRRSKRRTA